MDAGTDLIPGLYEGGLKTWEGGVDLVEVLGSLGDVGEWVRGSKVLEVGLPFFSEMSLRVNIGLPGGLRYSYTYGVPSPLSSFYSIYRVQDHPPCAGLQSPGPRLGHPS